MSTSTIPARPVPTQTPSMIQRVQQLVSLVRKSAAAPGSDSRAGSFENTLNFIANGDLLDAISVNDLPAFVDAIQNMKTGIDDRLLLLETFLVIMSRLGDTDVSKQIQQHVINMLYKDLPHPPSNFVALPSPLSTPQPTPGVATQDPKVSYAFRSADGTNYNVFQPSLGAAKTPYARSVPPVLAAPPHTRPDAGLLFDTLLRRPDGPNGFKPHPDGISSLFFAFADLVIHSIFNSDHRDPNINNASSYLDLSILYGSSDADIQKIRRNDGSGMLYEDVFADSRLMSMPASACALLVLLSRNHNYIATKLLDINERGSFEKDPLPHNAEKRQAQDDELFQRARLVNAGYFMQIILGDYVGAILGLARDGYDWRLDPLQVIRESNHELAPRGEGNAVSIEFNLLYRWHATLSQEDTKWTNDVFEEILPGQSKDTVTPKDFINGVRKNMERDPDPRKWVFGGLQRDAKGRFNDSDIAKILQDATEWTAGAFGARNTPAVMRVIEIMAIESSRKWGASSLNEFRQFIGLKAYESFEEWNPDPAIHLPAAALYKDINNLELHVGLQAEETKKPGPGAGLCPGYTISRTILADAVCLTRSDRFLTTEMNPNNLTHWGYQDVQFPKGDGSYGGLLTKLLFRTLPNHYPARSAYAHFPFLVPSRQHAHMRASKRIEVSSKADQYIWTRPPAPTSLTVIDTYADAKFVLDHPDKFVSAYAHRKETITGPNIRLNTALVEEVLLKPKMEFERYFDVTLKELIKARSVQLNEGSPVRYLDVVQDVINVLPLHWIATQVIGMPLKEELHNPRGTIPESVMYDAFADVCNYIHLNFDPVNDWRLRERATKTYAENVERLQEHLKSVSLSNIALGFTMESNNTKPFLQQLVSSAKVSATASKFSNEDLAASIFMQVVPTAAHMSQAIAHVVDFFLDEDKTDDRLHIVELAARKTPDGDRQIMAYVREALRLNPIVSGVYRTAVAEATVGSKRINAGDRVLVSIINANLDTDEFGPQPETPVYDRPSQKSGILGVGELGLLSSKMFDKVVPDIVGTILGLQGLKRELPDGGLKQFTQNWHGTPERLYFDSRSQVVPFPDTLAVRYTVA